MTKLLDLSSFLWFNTWAKISKHVLQEIWSLLMKIIYTVHKLSFFKTSDLYTLDK